VTVVGEIALWVALFLSLWGCLASIAGAKLGRPELLESGRRSTFATAGMVAVASVGLWVALVRHDLSLRYVATHSTLNTPTVYLLTAFWAGPAGRMLFLALAIALAAAAPAIRDRELDASVRTSVVAILTGLAAVMLAVVCFGTNPFDRLEWVPAEGQGLDPDLQRPLAPIYFIATQLGYGAATMLIALAGTAAILGRLDDASRCALRRWATICWSALTIALVARMRWVYLDPTAGGFGRPGGAQLATAAVWLASFAILWLRVQPANPRSSEHRRLRRAGAIAHALGLAMIVVGIVASRSWITRPVAIRPGAAAELTDRFGGRWRFISQGVSRDEGINYLSTSVALETHRNEAQRGIVSAERRQYLDSVQRPTSEPVLRPGVWSSPRQDVYVVLAGLDSDDATLRIGFRPLVALVWIGWLVLLGGGLTVALLPRRVGASAVS
jgi:cytochrome c biogenesis factor